jgi:hypothetical protein
MYRMAAEADWERFDPSERRDAEMSLSGLEFTSNSSGYEINRSFPFHISQPT